MTLTYGDLDQALRALGLTQTATALRLARDTDGLYRFPPFDHVNDRTLAAALLIRKEHA